MRRADRTTRSEASPARRCESPSSLTCSKLPSGLTKHQVLGLMDAVFELGPFGFRGPAGAHMPDHLTSLDWNARTTQVIAPGYACYSNRFIARAMDLINEDHLYITSANRSRHVTGAEDEPAHFRGSAIKAEFGNEQGFVVLRHPDEEAARTRYPQFSPMSTTILAFHKLGNPTPAGRPRLFVERHGSMHVDDLRPIVERLGFGLELGPKAQTRLPMREYAGPPSPASINPAVGFVPSKIVWVDEFWPRFLGWSLRSGQPLELTVTQNVRVEDIDWRGIRIFHRARRWIVTGPADWVDRLRSA